MVTIHTDGSAKPNPGAGGWAYVAQINGVTVQGFGGEPNTTNNRMEILAAVMALRIIKPGSPVELFTDSKYLQEGIQKWVQGWKRKGWKTKTGDPVKNQDLWMELDKWSSRLGVQWKWCKGHANTEMNILCDRLAQAAARATSASEEGRASPPS